MAARLVNQRPQFVQVDAVAAHHGMRQWILHQIRDCRFFAAPCPPLHHKEHPAVSVSRMRPTRERLLIGRRNQSGARVGYSPPRHSLVSRPHIRRRVAFRRASSTFPIRCPAEGTRVRCRPDGAGQTRRTPQFGLTPSIWRAIVGDIASCTPFERGGPAAPQVASAPASSFLPNRRVPRLVYYLILIYPRNCNLDSWVKSLGIFTEGAGIRTATLRPPTS